VRLTGIIAIAAVSAPLPAGCGSDYSKKPWIAYDRKCERLGFKRGLLNIPNAASNWRAMRRHEGARRRRNQT
jgi:hypothetical protein